MHNCSNWRGDSGKVFTIFLNLPAGDSGSFGPRYENFREAVDLLSLKGADTFLTYEDFKEYNGFMAVGRENLYFFS